VVGHLDLDYFYAQVEEVEDPSLRVLPVVVCVYSGRTEDSGVVSTANYKARELGVKSGIPIVLAKRRLEGKGAKFITMDHAKYETYSERVMEFVKESVDVMEQTGIDETFFDITKKSRGLRCSGRHSHRVKAQHPRA
jgi:DNA polymerase IV (DinB-like DNA polymerase)